MLCSINAHYFCVKTFVTVNGINFTFAEEVVTLAEKTYYKVSNTSFHDELYSCQCNCYPADFSCSS